MLNLCSAFERNILFEFHLSFSALWKFIWCSHLAFRQLSSLAILQIYMLMLITSSLSLHNKREGALPCACKHSSTSSKKNILTDRSLFMQRGGMKKICWKDQNFCKAPLQTTYIASDPPSLFNTYVMTPPPHISSFMLSKAIIKMHVLQHTDHKIISYFA